MACQQRTPLLHITGASVACLPRPSLLAMASGTAEAGLPTPDNRRYYRYADCSHPAHHESFLP